MEDSFKSISDFIKFKEYCVFCKVPLRASVTNFIGTDGDGSALFSANLKDGKFCFSFEHTGYSYFIGSDVTIEPVQNLLTLSVVQDTEVSMPVLDEYVVKQNLDNVKPYIELVCDNKECGMGYHLCSEAFKFTKVPGVKATWSISPFKLFLESFKTQTLIVQNDWIEKITRIYTLKNEEADPIKCPLVDFEGMDKDRLLNRVQLLVTFS